MRHAARGVAGTTLRAPRFGADSSLGRPGGLTGPPSALRASGLIRPWGGPADSWHDAREEHFALCEHDLVRWQLADAIDARQHRLAGPRPPRRRDRPAMHA